MLNFREIPRLALSLLRTLLYSFCMAILCAIWVLAWSGVASYVFYLFEVPPPPPANPYEDDYSFPLWFFFAFMTVCFGFVAFVIGASLGLLIAVSKSDRDSYNPFASSTFCAIAKRASYFLLLSMSFFYVGGFIVILDTRWHIFEPSSANAICFGSIWGLVSISIYLYGILKAIGSGNIVQQSAKID